MKKEEKKINEKIITHRPKLKQSEEGKKTITNNERKEKNQNLCITK